MRVPMTRSYTTLYSHVGIYDFSEWRAMCSRLCTVYTASCIVTITLTIVIIKSLNSNYLHAMCLCSLQRTKPRTEKIASWILSLSSFLHGTANRTPFFSEQINAISFLVDSCCFCTFGLLLNSNMKLNCMIDRHQTNSNFQCLHTQTNTDDNRTDSRQSCLVILLYLHFHERDNFKINRINFDFGVLKWNLHGKWWRRANANERQRDDRKSYNLLLFVHIANANMCICVCVACAIWLSVRNGFQCNLPTMNRREFQAPGTHRSISFLWNFCLPNIKQFLQPVRHTGIELSI